MPGTGAGGTAFEAVIVWIVRRIDAEYGAQVKKEWLRASTFGERVVLPLGDKLGWNQLVPIVPFDVLLAGG